MGEEKFIDRGIGELSEEYAKIFGSVVNISRITPNLIDGLKVVQRRLLYIMFLKDQGKTYQKVMRISGDTSGKIHPHGAVSVEASLINLAQPWNNNIPLIDGLGNYGCCTGDSAAAPRYIEARLSEYAYECFFSDWKESAVDMVMGADNETKEPLYLPAKYPNILLNGLLGIGYGKSSQICPYCFREVIETTILLMGNPHAEFLLIPDSPTGCDIVAGNFHKICETGTGAYTMRCKYEIDMENNLIMITALPYQVTVNTIREKIAEIKERNGLPELINMQDHSGKVVNLQLFIRGDVNPYKFMRKLIESIGGLERSYPVNITVVEDYRSYDLSVRQLLIEWIRYRREQKRTVINHRRTLLLGEQRTNDVRIFVMQGNNLEETVQIFRSSRNRQEIEQRLIGRYRDTPIRMDSLQAKSLSDLRMHELCQETYERFLARQAEIEKELSNVGKSLSEPNGIDQLIVEELRDGAKRFGSDRKSNVVPYKISVETEIAGECILQLSSDGIVIRRPTTNLDGEPLPLDHGGFAVKVENDSSFIAIDENGYFAFITVKELPIDSEVPLNRFIRGKLGNIIALLPFDIESDKHCTLISRYGTLKKFKINEMKPSKKPCIDLPKGDLLVRGIVSKKVTGMDILVYTDQGFGQRLDPNSLRITSYQAKGLNGFNLQPDDHIVGCYLIDPRNRYLLYITSKGKGRLNLTEYLPLRDSKHDDMVRLITVSDRDHLVAVVGCDTKDKLQIFYQDHTNEIIAISTVPEGTMGSPPTKIVREPMTSNRVIKVKLL